MLFLLQRSFFESRKNTSSLSVNSTGLSRKHIMESVDASLKRLGTDYIDLYQIHRWDVSTPIEETMEVLHDLVRSGRVHYIGASSMWTWQFAKAQFIAEKRGMTKFISMQNHYNLIYREEEREMLPFCHQSGVGVIPWSPIARGYLAGSRKRGDNNKITGDTVRSKSDPMAAQWYALPNTYDNDFDIIERVAELASKKGVTSSQIALAWMLHRPEITAPIIGATKMSHLEEAVAAVHIQLTPEEITYLQQLYKPHAVVPSLQ